MEYVCKEHLCELAQPTHAQTCAGPPMHRQSRRNYAVKAPNLEGQPNSNLFVRLRLDNHLKCNILLPT